MQLLLILSGLASSISIIFALIVLLYGILTLFIGRFGMTKKNLIKGPNARIAGVILIIHILVALGINMILHEALEWGYQRNSVQSDIGSFVIWTLFSVFGLLLAGKYVRSRKSEQKQ